MDFSAHTTTIDSKIENKNCVAVDSEMGSDGVGRL
jgi:hypothetical protein